MAKLVIKIPYESVETYSQFIDSENPGITVELLKNETRICIDSGYYNMDIESVNVGEAKFFIELFEQGGGKTSTGSGTVICDEKGKPFSPVEVFKTGHLANNLHARFHVKKGYEVTSNKYGLISIMEYSLSENDKEVSIKSQLIWKGRKDLKPEIFKNFDFPVVAAYAKANCYHCRSPHFVFNF